VLQHLIELLRQHGIVDVAINLHYRPEAIVDYFGDGGDFGVRITYSHEERLLGSAGAAKRLQPFLDETFVAIYGDVLCALDLDELLDLHSMLWASDPLMLCGGTEKGLRLAHNIGVPDLVVADHGHAGGRRLIDYPRFSDPGTPFAANLVEAGLHWEPETVGTALATIAGLLRYLDMVREPTALLPPPPRQSHQRVAQVTETVTATTGKFSFVQPWRGGDIIPRRNTLIALDGGTEIRTPHDECLLVMPSLRPSRGHTAVRLARFL